MPHEAVLDTSAWIAIFNGEPAADRLALMDQRLVTTPLILAELSVRHRLGKVRVAEPVSVVEARARLENLTREDALAGAETYTRLRARGRKVSLADALIHATARRIGADLVTTDTDLRGEPGVVLEARGR